MKIKHIIISPTSFFAIRTKVTFSSHMYARITKECEFFSPKSKERKAMHLNRIQSQPFQLCNTKHSFVLEEAWHRKKKEKEINTRPYVYIFLH